MYEQDWMNKEYDGVDALQGHNQSFCRSRDFILLSNLNADLRVLYPMLKLSLLEKLRLIID